MNARFTIRVTLDRLGKYRTICFPRSSRYGAVGVLLRLPASTLRICWWLGRREIAIRTSLGAGQVAIVRQQLGESVLLAALGGALGIALARWSLDALVAFAPADLLRVSDLSVDLRVLLYTLGLSMLTGLIVGIVPALLVTRQSILSSIRASGLTITHLMTRIPRQASSSTKRSRQPTCPTSIRYTRR